jgi:hypothetical protein
VKGQGDPEGEEKVEMVLEEPWDNRNRAGQVAIRNGSSNNNGRGNADGSRRPR